MQCPRCHAENREGRRFCGECGLSFASACPSCGFLNDGTATTMYREMDMRFWLEKAEAELNALR